LAFSSRLNILFLTKPVIRLFFRHFLQFLESEKRSWKVKSRGANQRAEDSADHPAAILTRKKRNGKKQKSRKRKKVEEKK
jgi:hypothetical protein